MRQGSVFTRVPPKGRGRSTASGGRVARRWAVLLVCAAAFAGAGVAGCTADFDPGDVSMSSADWARHIQQGRDTTTSETTSALVMGTPKRTRTIAAMMFDISGGPPNATTIINLIRGTGTRSVTCTWRRRTGCRTCRQTCLGPYTLPVANCLTIACCGPSSDRTGNGSTVSQLISGLGKTYDHYFWVYGKLPSGADCGTWGDEGTPTTRASTRATHSTSWWATRRRSATTSA